MIQGRAGWILRAIAAGLILGFAVLDSSGGSSRASGNFGSSGNLPDLPPPLSTRDTGKDSASVTSHNGLDPARWRNLPEIPAVSQHAREIYELGQSLGNDPNAFSIFGDCQSLPEVFLGMYVTDKKMFSSLPADLQETVTHFRGSLNRSSPTSKDGTTSGALLWEKWHENKFDCTRAETPMDCELRQHNPSFVLIMVGTHWEGARNEYYLRIILDALLERGVLPILSTKADNREGDNSLNLQAAELAAEYDLPLWNFWTVVNDLPNRGLYTKETERRLGDIYLTDQALALRRFSALRLLDAIWRAVAN
jgi:hypothetical protein